MATSLGLLMVAVLIIAFVTTPCLGQIGDGSYTVVEVNQRPSLCHLAPETGHCRAHVQRYYYDPDTGRCRLFVYGGCGGNDNNFSSARDCRRSCTLFSN